MTNIIGQTNQWFRITCKAFIIYCIYTFSLSWFVLNLLSPVIPTSTTCYDTDTSSSSYIFHRVGPLVDPFRAHVSRSLLEEMPVQRLKVATLPLDLPCSEPVTHSGEISTTGKSHGKKPDRLSLNARYREIRCNELGCTACVRERSRWYILHRSYERKRPFWYVRGRW